MLQWKLTEYLHELKLKNVVKHGIKLKYAIPSYIGSFTTDVVLKLVTNH